MFFSRSGQPLCCPMILSLFLHFCIIKQLFSVPGASGSRYNRRHSYTPKSPPPNVASITKDMSKLGMANNTGRGLSPRPSTKRRASTYNRRSSRSGKQVLI